MRTSQAGHKMGRDKFTNLPQYGTLSSSPLGHDASPFWLALTGYASAGRMSFNQWDGCDVDIETIGIEETAVIRDEDSHIEHFHARFDDPDGTPPAGCPICEKDCP